MELSAPRQPDTSGVNSIYLHSINKEETPLEAAGGVSEDCYQSARFLMPLLWPFGGFRQGKKEDLPERPLGRSLEKV